MLSRGKGMPLNDKRNDSTIQNESSPNLTFAVRQSYRWDGSWISDSQCQSSNVPETIARHSQRIRPCNYSMRPLPSPTTSLTAQEYSGSLSRICKNRNHLTSALMTNFDSYAAIAFKVTNLRLGLSPDKKAPQPGLEPGSQG
jgi:hypothetical protein